MGYRVKRIKALEEENKRLSQEKEFWNKEAIRQAAELGEMKIKIIKALNKLEPMQEVAVE